jgi:flagellar biogenesis protein FliO
MARPRQDGSILMRSALARLGGALGIVVLLWLAVAWALR